MKRVAGYVLSAILASLFYVTWLSLVPIAGDVDAQSRVGFALFFWFFGGFGPALALMSLPWIIAVRAYPKQRWPGPIYFAGVGAFGAFIIGCATASLSPKPFFIEDQTFFQGALIAAERQGVCMLLAGTTLGLAYWFLSERQIFFRKKQEVVNE